MFKSIAACLLVAAPLSGAAVADPVDNSAYVRTVAHFETAVRTGPNDSAAWLNLGMAYRALGQTSAANAAFTRVLALDNVTLQDRFGSDVWSHTLARQAMSTDTQVTLR